jgi:hypothetical protein
VRFSETDAVLRLAADSDAIVPLRFVGGSPAVLLSSGEHVVVEAVGGDAAPGAVRLTDGREVDEAGLCRPKLVNR